MHFLFQLFLSSTFINTVHFDRRTIITSIPPTLNRLANKVNKDFVDLAPNEHNKTDDPYAHWSFFNLAPPPVKQVLNYDELLYKINNDQIVSIQIAVQHDCIIAISNEGYRYTAPIKDNDFNILISDSIRKNGNIPFEIKKIDIMRKLIRDFAISTLETASILFIFDTFDLLPWDTTSYSSIKEREDAIRSGEKPKKWYKQIIDIFNNTLHNKTK